MSRWFRYYDEALNDRKVQALSGDLFKHWVNVLCIASKHGGVLPNVSEVAFGLGRISESKAAAIVASLAQRELLDRVPGGYFRPHNWDSRQYKSDVSNDRVKQHRERKRNVSCNVTLAVTETPPEAETEQRQIDDEHAGARTPLVTEQAYRIADAAAKIVGHDPDFVPPEWLGAAYRTQQWLNQGWPEELITLSIREQIAKKRDGPPSRIEYFEKGIASTIARQNAPIPTATVTEIRGRHEAPAKSGLAAIDRIFDSLENRPGVLAAADENAVLSLPARSVPGA